ncbi:PTS glucose transporter subunit IIA [Lachnospiraceae bacterium 54-53]
MIFETKRAIALVSPAGVELLIHIGLDTVNLQGKYFDVLVESGQKVTRGQPLVKINREAMIAEQYKLVTPLIITNTDQFNDFSFIMEQGSVAMGQELLIVKNQKEGK